MAGIDKFEHKVTMKGVQQISKRLKVDPDEIEMMFPILNLAYPLVVSKNFYEDFPSIFNDLVIYSSSIAESSEYDIPFIVLYIRRICRDVDNA